MPDEARLARLASNTPPLHYRCRSILSPIDKHEFEDLQKENGFEERTNWSKVDDPARDFGKDIQEVIGGKLAKKGEKKESMIEISEKEIKAVANRFADLKKVYPELVGNVSEVDLRKVADYLNDPDPDLNELYAWRQLKKSNLYGYTIFIHENMEIQVLDELIRNGRIDNYYQGNIDNRTEAHGKALFEQYKILQQFVFQQTGRKYCLTQLCASDYWYEDDNFDNRNARTLRKYLKKYAPAWYNENERRWKKDRKLREFFRRLREE